ncbi:MAG: hypothetical protein ACFFCT_13950 [Candidatus Odinarchaeota archaeon]
MRFKHVFILMILILPMFAFAPTLVANQHETLMSPSKVDTSLPSSFVEETLRVAVYAEPNTTLPSYATGGVYTTNYQNVIDLLESEGYAVTALSTEDILDRKLMVADYDAFILPDQLPKDSIINHVKDYWLGGGGILSFESSVGYLFYIGMIHSSYEGDFMLYPTNPDGRWAYRFYDGILTNSRNTVTKSLQGNTEYSFAEDAVYIGGFDLVPLIGSRYIELAVVPTNPGWSSMFALDNPEKGGKIVFLPGNCSSFEPWIEPVISDAIDWIAPHPKGRIAIDLTHVPYYGVDSWDQNVSFAPRYNIYRDFLVNHSFTFDKLFPKGSAALTASDIAPYDVLMLNVPSINYTTAEISMIKTWVQNGGSLFILGDWIIPTGQQNLNQLMSAWGLSLNQVVTNMGTFTTSEFEPHPVLEGIVTITITGGKWINVSSSAYPIVKSGPNIAIGGAEIGEGRVILSGDINFLDKDHIADASNARFGINVMNWLSASKAKVLVYADYYTAAHPNFVPLKGPVAQALNDLHIPFFMTESGNYFNMSLHLQEWDMVVFDNNQYGTTSYQRHLIDFAMGGGKIVISTWALNATVGDYFGVRVFNAIGPIPPVLITSPTHPIFNLPVDYGAGNLTTILDLGFGTNALNLTVHANATKLAGYSGYSGGAITINTGGNVIVNGLLLTMYCNDTDDSTYPDNLEIWENEIAFLYFDRPTINHPSDVTYMETETGNEITWTPSADAGPWEYVLRVNGSIDTTLHWTGGPITINVDGINASITEYELTVYDRLGYSVSDLVVLNVTEYVAPPPGGGGIDPMILIAVGAGVVIVVVIILIVMQKNKKK